MREDSEVSDRSLPARRRPSKARARPARTSGGRPSKAEAARLGERILSVATRLFLAQGYSSTSIEEVARRARVSKRTFYHRFADKSDLFRAVVRRIIARVRPPEGVELFQGSNAREMLEHVARLMLRGALSPQTLALHRMIIGESGRFPKLAAAVNDEGAADQAVRLIAGLLDQEVRAGRLMIEDTTFVAEQFMHMVIAIPQRRAIGLGAPMTAHALEEWPRRVVALLLSGCSPRQQR